MFEYLLRIIKNYSKAFKNGFIVEGRATRIEFISFFIITELIILLLSVSQDLFWKMYQSELQLHLLDDIYRTISRIPLFVISLRRINDTGNPAWHIIVPGYNLYLLFYKKSKS